MMKLKDIFKRKRKYASPYYGGNGPLANAPRFPVREEEEQKPVTTKTSERIPMQHPNDADWEQRRFELVKMLVGQDRRSVVLGKLKASDKQIASKARVLADAAINELINHPMRANEQERKTQAEGQ